MPYQGQSLAFEDYHAADIASVDRPDPVGRERKKLPFWVKDDPVFNKHGKIERGGMFAHQRAWWELPTFIKVMVAGFGCIAGETKILDPETGVERTAEELHRIGKPIRVLSLFPDGHTEVRDASAPFVKGTADLYRVTLEDGRSVTITDLHRFLTPRGWASLADGGVCVGRLVGCGPSLPGSSGGPSRTARPRGVGRCSHTGTNSRGSCSAYPCPGDGRLPFSSAAAPAFFPSPAGAPGRTHWNCGPGGRGGRAARSRAYREGDPRATLSSCCPAEPHGGAPLSPACASAPAPLPGSSRGPRPSPASKAPVRWSPAGIGGRSGSGDGGLSSPSDCGSGSPHRPKFGGSGLALLENPVGAVSSFPPSGNDDEFPQDHEDAAWSDFAFRDPNRWIRVSKIEFIRTDKFYDLTVPGPANYLAEGVWHHNSGKTLIGAKRIIATALQNAPVAVAAVSPSFPLARKTIVPTIEALLAGKRQQYGKQFWYKYNKGFHFFTIRYKGRTATIYILSGEDPDSLRGPNLGAVWLDEPFLMERAVFDHMIARIRHPDATIQEMVLTGTPEQLGWGYDLCMGDLKAELKEQGDIDVGLIQASTRANLALSPSYVKRLEGSFTSKMVEAFVEGNFVNLAEGLVYYAFTPKAANELECNIRELPEPEACELGVGLDFNVNPMAATVFWRAGAHMHFFDEIELPNADTEYMMQVLRERYVDETRETKHILDFIYPDASGSARKTSAPGGKTDFHYIREAGFTINAPTENPKRKDRYNAVNGKFKPKEGRTTLTVSPKCKHLVKYLQTYTHEEMHKQERMSHLLDSAGYPIYRLFPIAHDRAGMYRLAGT